MAEPVFDALLKRFVMHTHGGSEMSLVKGTHVVKTYSGSSSASSYSPAAWVIAPTGYRNKADAYINSDGLAAAVNDAASKLSPAGGGTIYVVEGAYSLTIDMNLKSNVNLLGDRFNTKIYLHKTASIKVASSSNVVIKGIYIDGDDMNLGPTFGIKVQDSSNIHIESCDLVNMGGFGIFVTAFGSNTTEKVWIQDNYVQGKAHADAIGGGPDNSTTAVFRDVFVENNIVIQDTVVAGGTDQTAINFVAPDGFSFSNNLCYGGILFGFEQFPHKNSRIDENIIKPAIGSNNTGLGLVIKGSATNAGANISVSNNTVSYGYIDLFCNPVTQRLKNVSIVNNNVDATNVTVAAVGGIGILAVNLDGAIIAENTIVNCIDEGISLNGTINSNIHNNILRDTGTYGIRERNSADNNIITENHFLGTITNKIITVGANSYSYNNPGVNPTSYYDYGTKTGSFTVDRANGSIQRIGLGGNISPTFANGTYKGDWMIVQFQQDSSGGWSVTFDSTVLFSANVVPPLNKVASTFDLIYFQWNGASWNAALLPNYNSSPYVKKSGDILTGALTVANSITIPNTTQQAVLDLQGNLSELILEAGGSAVDNNNYLESGNLGFSGNVPLRITGYNANLGSILQLKFATIGLGTVNTPTALLHLQAGSASANTAPLKFNSGTLLTTAEAGAIEFLTDKFYATITTGAVRKELALVDAALTSGRVPYVTTNGRLLDASNFLFDGSTLTVPALVATSLALKAGNSSGNIAKAGGAIFDHYSDAGNSTTTETDLYSDTIPASVLNSNGDKLEAEYGGLFVSSGTATREIKIYFGGTVIFDTGALTLSLSSAWTGYVTIIRVSSTVIRYMISLTTEGAALAAYTATGELTGLTLSNTNILKITGQAAGVGAATNDIVAKLGNVSFIPAA